MLLRYILFDHSTSQPLFHGWTPKIIFHILRNPYPWQVYRPEKVESREPFCCHQWGSHSVTTQNRQRHSTTKYKLKEKLTKTKKQVVGSTQRLFQHCQLPQKNSRHFMEYLEFFMVFQTFCYLVHWKTLLYVLPDDTVQVTGLCTQCSGVGYDAAWECHAMPLLVSPHIQHGKHDWMFVQS
jgi:hypothetical protein